MNGEGGSQLLDFLRALSDAEELLRRFWTNPERTMAEEGLTDEERDLILNGDLTEIRKRIEAEGTEVLFVPPVHVHPVHYGAVPVHPIKPPPED
jgi:hypothetical protein